jgi:hypothetical protein
MRSLIPILTILAFSLALYATASANTPAPATPRMFLLGDDRTNITVDTAASVINIFIDGRKQAFIDKDGLHVRGNITNTGATGSLNEFTDEPSAQTQTP